MNLTQLRNKISQALYRPGKGDIFNAKSFKVFDELNKLLEDELPALGGRKKRTAGKESEASDKKASDKKASDKNASDEEEKE